MTIVVMFVRPLLAAALAVGLAGLVSGCSLAASGRSDGRVEVLAAFYPLQFVAQQVGGDAVHVDNLVSPGVEPHDVELTARQVAAIDDAKLVVYLKGLQPAVDAAVDDGAKDHSFDVTTATPLKSGYVPLEDGELQQDEKGKDPHVWLDPVRLATIADAVAARLATIEPDKAATFKANAAALRGKLTALDAEYRRDLSGCKLKTIVVSHNAFGYLSARYGLVQVPITGLTPEEEPTPARLAHAARFARANGVRVIFFETLVSPKIARTLAREVGAKAEVLDPLEGLAKGSTGDYFSVMRSNLKTLEGALQCG
jgi:zinc transport system substrate-binding protein